MNLTRVAWGTGRALMALTIAVAAVSATSPETAYARHGDGAAIALGIIGGALAGTAIASLSVPGYYGTPPAYHYPYAPPAYAVAPAPAYYYPYAPPAYAVAPAPAYYYSYAPPAYAVAPAPSYFSSPPAAVYYAPPPYYGAGYYNGDTE